MFKSLKGWRTISVNLVALLAAIATSQGWLPPVDPTVAVSVVAIANFVLRFVTDTSVFSNT